VVAIQVVVPPLLLLRAVLFLLRPAFGVRLGGALGAVAYPWFFYPVPEIVAGCLVLLVTAPHGRDGTARGGRGACALCCACVAATAPTCCIEAVFAAGRCCCCCCCCRPDGSEDSLERLERDAARLQGPFGERLLWRLAGREGREMLELVMRTGPALSERDSAVRMTPEGAAAAATADAPPLASGARARSPPPGGMAPQLAAREASTTDGWV